MFFQSIRWRLQIWYGLILIAVLVGFGVTAYQLESNRVFRRIDDELHRRLSALANASNPPPRGPGPDDGSFHPFDTPGGKAAEERRPMGPRRDRPPLRPSERFRDNEGNFRLPARFAALFDETDTNGFYFVIWTPDGKELARSSHAPTNVAFDPESEPDLQDQGPMRESGPRPPEPARMRGVFREVLVFARGEVVLVGRSIKPELAELRRTSWILFSVGGIILLLGLAGGWWLASRAIRPIQGISAAALKIAAGDLSQRIDVAETESELGQLASVLNSTFTRLEAAFTQQQQFASDAAHELRTPVSVMLTQTQTALHRERSAAEYRETVEACQRSAQRMRRLLESLLELARLDAGQ
ncbi:MAG: histidine kinase dimerization/phospho-acceptor domain-containing protein [Verrucomicrobiota bacterium]